MKKRVMKRVMKKSEENVLPGGFYGEMQRSPLLQQVRDYLASELSGRGIKLETPNFFTFCAEGCTLTVTPLNKQKLCSVFESESAGEAITQFGNYHEVAYNFVNRVVNQQRNRPRAPRTTGLSLGEDLRFIAPEPAVPADPRGLGAATIGARGTIPTRQDIPARAVATVAMPVTVEELEAVQAEIVAEIAADAADNTTISIPGQVVTARDVNPIPEEIALNERSLPQGLGYATAAAIATTEPAPFSDDDYVTQFLNLPAEIAPRRGGRLLEEALAMLDSSPMEAFCVAPQVTNMHVVVTMNENGFHRFTAVEHTPGRAQRYGLSNEAPEAEGTEPEDLGVPTQAMMEEAERKAEEERKAKEAAEAKAKTDAAAKSRLEKDYSHTISSYDTYIGYAQQALKKQQVRNENTADRGAPAVARDVERNVERVERNDRTDDRADAQAESRQARNEARRAEPLRFVDYYDDFGGEYERIAERIEQVTQRQDVEEQPPVAQSPAENINAQVAQVVEDRRINPERIVDEEIYDALRVPAELLLQWADLSAEPQTQEEPQVEQQTDQQVMADAQRRAGVDLPDDFDPVAERARMEATREEIGRRRWDMLDRAMGRDPATLARRQAARVEAMRNPNPFSTSLRASRVNTAGNAANNALNDVAADPDRP